MSASGERRPWLTIAICGIAMAGVAWLGWLLAPSALSMLQGERVGHTYYIPSQSMRPTLQIDDHVMPLVVGDAGLRRGDIVVFRTSDQVRVARVAALGGDTIEMRNGIVTVDGRVAPQKLVGAGPPQDDAPTRLLLEQFPGDSRSHRILDLGSSPFDTFGPLRVGTGKVFMLGDNRDRAADSRAPLLDGGVGQVRQSDVIGIVDTVYWSNTRARIGLPIDAAPVQGDRP